MLGDFRRETVRAVRWRVLAAVLIACSASSGVAYAAGTPAQIARPAAAARAQIAAAPRAQISTVPGAQQLQLVLPLTANLGALERFARAVSTPGSRRYGQYESIPQLARRFGASSHTRRAVTRYLRAAGASAIRIDATGLFADATLSARAAQRLFGTPLSRFRTAHSGQFIAPSAPSAQAAAGAGAGLGAPAAQIPAGLQGLVTTVVGLDTRPLVSSSARVRRSAAAHAASQPSSALPRSGTPSGCGAGVSAGATNGSLSSAGFVPNQYRTAYGFDGMYGAGFSGQGERVALIEIDGFSPGDIGAFAACFGIDIPSIQAFGVGTRRPLPPGGESTLDLEVLDAAAPDLAGIDVYETKPNAATTLRALTAPLQNGGHHPQVISASLGLCEPAVFSAVGIRGLRSAEAALSMAAASGTTVLASSGDQGSADCAGPDGVPLRRLSVNYPASSPWVTGVGGTNITLDHSNNLTGQLVWNDANLPPGSAAGGGLSDLFRRPAYQKGTVRPNHRAEPDVSMLADIIPGFAVFCSARGDCVNSSNSNPWQSVGGTSAATPLLAGGLALVDQELRAREREDLGLVNPLLYKLGRSSGGAGVFSDVLQYGNDVGPFIGGNSHALGCCSARGGFDFASGWGSINITNFAGPAVLLQPPHIDLALPRHQHPVRKRALLATVSCADRCRMGAYAQVRIGRGKAFEVDSSVHKLGSAGSQTIPLRFSRRQLRKLHHALAAHTRIVASVFGVAIEGRRTIQAQTGAKKLRIRA